MQGTVRAEITIRLKSSSYSKICPIQNVSNSALKLRVTQRLLTEGLKVEHKFAAGKFYSPSLENNIHQATDFYVFKSMFCQSVKSVGSQKCQLCVVALLRMWTGAAAQLHQPTSVLTGSIFCQSSLAYPQNSVNEPHACHLLSPQEITSGWR